MDETKPKTIETISSEELGLALPQQYQALIQAQQNIQAITQELDKRKQRYDLTKKELENDNGTK